MKKQLQACALKSIRTLCCLSGPPSLKGLYCSQKKSLHDITYMTVLGTFCFPRYFSNIEKKNNKNLFVSTSVSPLPVNDIVNTVQALVCLMLTRLCRETSFGKA